MYPGARWVRKTIIAVLSLMAVACVSRAELFHATPEQRFFDWTKLQFPAREYAARRDALTRQLTSAGGGVFLAPALDGFSGGETFRQLDDFLYFTGLELPNSMLLIDADAGTTTLFAPEWDRRFESSARANDFPRRPLAADPTIAHRSGIATIRPVEELKDYVAARVAEGRPLWVDVGRTMDLETWSTGFLRELSPEQALTLRLDRVFTEADLRNAYEAVARLRMIKSPQEIEAIRRAVRITANGIRTTATKIRDGVDERTLEGVLEASFKRDGSQRVAFDSIIKSGPNSLWPWRILAAHNDRRDRTMHDGELVIFDVGCEIDHYSSDVGRTFPVSGRFTDDQRERLQMITDVSDTVIAAIHPGVTFGDLREVALSAIPESERRYMQASLFFGHHIGLNVGDPSLADAILEPGMIFTVEPWYYNHDLGIAVFVEDDVLVTADGAENLTRGLPRRPAELEAIVASRAPQPRPGIRASDNKTRREE